MKSIRSFVSGLRQRPRGHLDHVARTRASGWAVLPQNDHGPASIYLYVDGRLKKSFEATLPRTDVAAQGGPLECGFDVGLSDAVEADGPVRLEFRIGPDGPLLKNGTVLLDGSEVEAEGVRVGSDEIIIADSTDYDAKVEKIDVSGISGWVRGIPEGTQVGVLVDGTLTSTVQPAPARSGDKATFNLELPISFYDGRQHDVSVIHVETGQPLPEGRRLQASAFNLSTEFQDAADDAVAWEPETAPETVFAILFLAEQRIDVSVYTNHENCRVVTDQAHLHDLARSEAMAATPVVVIDRTTPRRREYLVQAVRRHWRFGGRYPTTAALVELERKAPRLRLRELKADDVGHTTFRGLTTFPAERMTDTAGMFALDLISTDAFFFVAPPSKFATALTSQEMASTQDKLTATKPTSDACETIFRNSSVMVDGGPNDWPIRHILSMYRYPSLAGIRVEGSASDVCMRNAEAAIRDVGRVKAHSSLPPDFETFAMALSLRPDVFVKFSPEVMALYLELTLKLEASDVIAERMAPYAPEICSADVYVTLPLFQFLATSLPQRTVDLTLSSVAFTTLDKKRQQHRIADCMRRFSSDVLLLQYLARIRARNPHLLYEDDFLDKFKRIVLRHEHDRIQHIVDRDTYNRIHARLTFEDIFHQNLVSGDRTQLSAMLDWPYALSAPDQRRWLDSLRGYSNELREFGLSIHGTPFFEESDLQIAKIASAVLCDRTSIEALESQSLIGTDAEIDIVCHNIIGNNEPLNTFIGSLFQGTGEPAPKISGKNIEDVFYNAALSTKSDAANPQNEANISVIITTYNPDLILLKASLESILNQSHTPLEVIVVDDCSDIISSADIEEVVSNAKVRFLRMPQNKGPYVCRNYAIGFAKGDFIAIQDADDWSHPSRLDVQARAMRESDYTKVVTSPHIRIDRAGCIQLESGFTILGDGPMTSMFRRSVFDDIGPFIDIRSRGDVEMRERIRWAYGPHSLTHLQLPMLLCLADSQTLSQRTKAEKREYLSLFRANIDRRSRSIPVRVPGDTAPQRAIINVPMPLRPNSKVENA